MAPPRAASEPATLWAGIHCLRLLLKAVWPVTPKHDPVAVHDASRPPRIVQVNWPAWRRGVRPGQTLDNALAVVPSLQSLPRNPAMEARLLEQLALIAYAHSHQVVLDPPDTVVLEITGSRRLRGSTDNILSLLEQQLMCTGLDSRIGTAVTPMAAGLLARLGRHADSHTALQRLLAQLPIDRLALPQGSRRALAGCGLRTLGEWLQLPLPERTRRFGEKFSAALLRRSGLQATALDHWRPPDECRLRLELPAATASSSALQFIFRRALDHVQAWMTARDHALTRLRIVLEREDRAGTIPLTLGLSRPGRDDNHLLELFVLKLESLRLPAAIDALMVAADSTAAYSPPQTDLFSGHNRGDAWSALLDRLDARLGEHGLASLAPCADHRPEHAVTWTRPGNTTPVTERSPPRPLWLLPVPRRCPRQRLCLEDGPERIESGWWDGEDICRDYWVARDSLGRRVWAFHEHRPRKGWFVHGFFNAWPISE